MHDVSGSKTDCQLRALQGNSALTGQLGKKALQDNYINNASPLNFNQFFLRTARLNFLEWLLHGFIPHLKMIVLKCE
jgi:hypothetical protein